MDSLKSLMDKKQYELVVKLTEKSETATDLFYRIAALTALNRGDEAILVIHHHRKILETRLSILIKIHLELLCTLGYFDEAFTELEYYKNIPYESQEVEELIASLPNYIRAEERKRLTEEKGITNEELNALLKSSNIDDVVPALDIVRNRDIIPFYDTLCNLMINHKVQSVRSFTLLVFVSKEIDEKVKFNHKGEILEVIPKELEQPFTGDEFNYFTNRLTALFKNPSLLETAMQLHATYIIYNYPVYEHEYTQEMIVALIEEAHRYLKSEPDIDLASRCLEMGVELEDVERLIDEIEEACQNF